MSKKVKLKDQLGRVITISADKGATVGADLRWPDGSIVQASEIRQVPTPSNDASPTLWKLIREIPANVRAIAAMMVAGFPARGPDGTWAQRKLVGAPGEVDVANGDGASGDPLIGLADVADSGTGVLQRTSFDAKGRKTGTAAATTDDLAEGTTNLYFQEAPNDGQQYARQSLGWSAVSGFSYDDLKASLVPGANITITPDDTAETLTITSTGGGGGGGVATVTGGTGVAVNNTDPDNPVVALSAGSIASLALADSALQPAAIGTTVQPYDADLTAWAAIVPSAKANSGAVGSSGLTMATARLLGRTTAGAGAVEEITVGSGLSLSGGTLTATGGGGSGTVTSVAVSGGTTGLTTSGGPITGAGTITLAGTLAVANGGTGATTAAGAPWVQKSGDTMTGPLTSTQFTSSGNVFIGGSAFAVLAVGSSGSVLLRPNGPASSTAQAELDSGGTFSAVRIQATGNTVVGGPTFAVFGPSGASGSVRLRPNGFGSTVGEVVIDPTAVSFPQPVTANSLTSSNNVTANTNVLSSNTFLVLATTGAGSVLIRPNGTGSSSGQVSVGSAGHLALEQQASEFYRAAANSAAQTRQPRIFVGGSDPGAAAANGDIWIP